MITAFEEATNFRDTSLDFQLDENFLTIIGWRFAKKTLAAPLKRYSRLQANKRENSLCIFIRWYDLGQRFLYGPPACAAGVERNLEMTETQRHHLEDEVRSLYRERSELVEQLNIVLRQKNALAEEVLGLRRENDRQGDTIGRLVKEKEDLAKDKAEHVVQITACERDNRQLSEVLLYQLNNNINNDNSRTTCLQ